jgi:hypothetical protein
MEYCVMNDDRQVYGFCGPRIERLSRCGAHSVRPAGSGGAPACAILLGKPARHAPARLDASEGFNVMREKIAMRSGLWPALVDGTLTPAGYVILAVIVVAIGLAAMLSTCWDRDGLDRVLRVGWWFW